MGKPNQTDNNKELQKTQIIRRKKLYLENPAYGTHLISLEIRPPIPKKIKFKLKKNQTSQGLLITDPPPYSSNILHQKIYLYIYIVQDSSPFPLYSKSSKLLTSQTIRARYLKYLLKVLCQVSCVTCRLSPVMCHLSPA